MGISEVPAVQACCRAGCDLPQDFRERSVARANLVAHVESKLETMQRAGAIQIPNLNFHSLPSISVLHKKYTLPDRPSDGSFLKDVPQMTREEFDEALLEAVDFAFQSLGPSIKKSMYYHLKTSFHLTKHSLPERIEEFDGILRFIFKDGAVILERLILKELCDRLKVRLNEKVARDFVKTVTSLRAFYSSDVTVTADLKRSSRQHKGHVTSETKNQRACHRRWPRNVCYRNSEDLTSCLSMVKCSIQNLKWQYWAFVLYLHKCLIGWESR